MGGVDAISLEANKEKLSDLLFEIHGGYLRGGGG
jgi:hypothetical protein